MSANQHGFANEDNLYLSLNNKQFKNLNYNLQCFIKDIHAQVKDNSKIICQKVSGQNKCDLLITIDNTNYHISIKMGMGNSVHQEPLEGFIRFLYQNYNLTDELANNIRFFIWGDNTYDGQGSIENRLSATQLKQQYPDVIESIKAFFSTIKIDLLSRFLLSGVNNNTVDYIYHGDSNCGLWASKEEFLNVVCNDTLNSRAAIPIGKLTFQAWNRSLSGNSENKRGVIQLKWPSLENDLRNILSVKGELYA